MEEVQEIVKNVLTSGAKCNVKNYNNNATFESLGFDSLDGVEMVVALEERFNLDITNEEAEKIQTVNDAVQIFYNHKLKLFTQADE